MCSAKGRAAWRRYTPDDTHPVARMGNILRKPILESSRSTKSSSPYTLEAAAEGYMWSVTRSPLCKLSTSR